MYINNENDSSKVFLDDYILGIDKLLLFSLHFHSSGISIPLALSISSIVYPSLFLIQGLCHHSLGGTIPQSAIFIATVYPCLFYNDGSWWYSYPGI